MTRRSPRTLLATLVLVWATCLAGTAFAWAPVGTELLLTDVGARALVGYGVRQGDRLVLQVSVDRAALRVLVAVPGSDARTVVGEIAEGRVWLFERGAWRDLATLLDGDGLTLVLRSTDGSETTIAPAPGTRPPGAAAPAGTAPAARGTTPAGDDDRDDDDDPPGDDDDASGDDGDGDAPDDDDAPGDEGDGDDDDGGESDDDGDDDDDDDDDDVSGADDDGDD